MRTLSRRLIHALKYKSIPGVASYLVRRSSLCNRGLASQFLAQFPEPYFFVPVPLHRARYRERGYNQAEKIAAALAWAVHGRVCKWLYRKTFHVSQTKLSFGTRLPEKMPTRGTVFSVDDVFTTGATTGACMAAFGKDFPLNVKICTLLYEEPATAVMDFVADNSVEWNP